MSFLAGYYLYLKAFHIIAVIAWMAGLLYLPRLFVYHSEAKAGSDLAETFKTMERRLLRVIMNPAMIVVWLLGILLIAANPQVMESGWFHLKLLCLVLLTALHMVFARWRRNFAADKNTRPASFYRLWNEAPTILMIIIVIVAVAKPF